MKNKQYTTLLDELQKVPGMIESLVSQSQEIRTVAQELKKYKHCFFLGRHYQLPIAYEGSLKFKEISYIHSEAYPAGELKHGPLALIDKSVPTIFMVPKDAIYHENISSLQEIQARKGKVLAVSNRKIPQADRQITIPKTVDAIYPFLTTVVGQLLAYHVADLLGKDIDKPRNLAKSVTVK